MGGGGAQRLMCGGSWFSGWNPVSWDIERNDDKTVQYRPQIQWSLPNACVMER